MSILTVDRWASKGRIVVMFGGNIDEEWKWMDGTLTPGYMDIEVMDNWIYEWIC
jgi:hypothetical protein